MQISACALIMGDCLDMMPTLPDESIHSVVTDPPYGLNFMGKKWDHDVPGVDVWAECLRVLKPGGHLLAFSGSRTYHRMVCNIEDAGFEIRDQIMWIYGSGFPKSHNLEGDKKGWGTALKPAHEPIVVARKPLIGTVAENALAHGTGALNIDACRIGTDQTLRHGAGNIPCRHDSAAPRGRDGEASAGRRYTERGATDFAAAPGPRGGDILGRWPANVIHDGSDEVVALFPDTGVSSGGTAHAGKFRNQYGDFDGDNPGASAGGFGDAGSAARFFYCAKAAKKDRGADNTHPTVKPTELMRYLCRLVTPPGGVVLDPFMGSGSTGKAALLEGFKFVGIEKEPSYLKTAEQRLIAEILS